MIEIWGIKNCQTVKKAIASLEQQGIAYAFIDYKKNPPSIEQIQAWVHHVGLEKVLNQKSKSYAPFKDLSVEELIEKMNEIPTLIRRPILVGEGILEFGFKKEVYENLT